MGSLLYVRTAIHTERIAYKASSWRIVASLFATVSRPRVALIRPYFPLRGRCLNLIQSTWLFHSRMERDEKYNEA